jgi:uncharacterized protein (TIGR02145 family)
MAENLRTTKYNDGTPIPWVTDSITWDSLTTPGFTWYNNDSMGYSNPYGALYNFFVVADTNSLNVCPIGWHVPADDDWDNLIDYLGGYGVAGGTMKETGTFYWSDPNTGATNESGFSGLPGGQRITYMGLFLSIGNLGWWWSSTEVSTMNALGLNLAYNNDGVSTIDRFKGNGCSVRCLRD